MRIRHDNLIEACNCAELHKCHIIFLTIDGKIFATYYDSVENTKKSFENLFVNGYLVVDNFIPTSIEDLNND